MIRQYASTCLHHQKTIRIVKRRRKKQCYIWYGKRINTMAEKRKRGSANPENKETREEVKIRSKDVVDRLSDLPDHVILKILSTVPIKEAVRTCILSSRWADVFTSISDIRLDGRLRNRALRNSFMNCVDGFLSSRKDIFIDRFLLICGEGIDPRRIDGWIKYVQELDLIIHSRGFSTLQFGVFTCKTVVVLTLSLRCLNLILNVPTNCSLPKLKVLRLVYPKFSDNESIARLISSCTSLEDLLVCELDNTSKLSVCNPKLKRLTIDGGNLDYELEINTPNLVYFKIEFLYWEATRHSFINLGSLWEAQIFIGVNIKSSEYFVEWVNMLGNCPYLETLGFDFKDRYPANLDIRREVPSCLVHHVKEINLFAFRGNEFELQFLKYLLEKAEVLERLTIKIEMKGRKREKIKMGEKIRALPKVSNKCQIFVKY